jgi:hypothetical protein
MGYINYQDAEDDLEDGLVPDSSISNRDLIESVDPSVSSPASQAVQDPDPSVKDYLMQQYLKQQQDQNNFNQAKIQSDTNNNIAQSFAQMAQGANTPKENPVFKNISDQNSQMLNTKTKDLDRTRMVMNAIENRKAKEALAQKSNDIRNASLDVRKQALQNETNAKQERLNGMNISRANSLLQNSNLSKETTKLNAARSVQSLVDAVKNGDIKDSKNIRNQLTNMIATIELGTPGGVSDRHEMGIDTLYSKLKDIQGRITSSPQSTIPREYLDQLESESHALGDRAAKNYIALKNGVLSGADLSGGNPDSDPGKIHQLIRQRTDKFLNETGYNPETGERLNLSSSTQNQPGQSEENSKTVVKRLYSPSRDKTKLIYQDGSEEIVDGKR